jgi:hypothetical protein
MHLEITHLFVSAVFEATDAISIHLLAQSDHNLAIRILLEQFIGAKYLLVNALSRSVG